MRVTRVYRGLLVHEKGLLVHVSGTFGTCKAYRGLLVLAFKPA